MLMPESALMSSANSPSGDCAQPPRRTAVSMIRVAVRSKDMGLAERSFTDPQSATVELIKPERLSGF